MSLLLSTTATEHEIETEDWPRCARCHMPVENFRVYTTSDSLIFVTECHEDVELATIPDDVWDTVIGTHLHFGQAFSQHNEEN